MADAGFSAGVDVVPEGVAVEGVGFFGQRRIGFGGQDDVHFFPFVGTHAFYFGCSS